MVAVYKEMLSNEEVGRKSSNENTVSRDDQGINVALPRDIHAAFKAVCLKRRVELKPTIAQVVRWLIQQKPQVQSVVMGIEDEMHESYAAILEGMAKQLREQQKRPPPFKVTVTLPDDPVASIRENDAPATAEQTPPPQTGAGQAAGKKARKH